jgi:transcriptional regulator
MYIPKFHEETRTSILHQFMRERPLASLITFGPSGLFASHLPMVLEVQETAPLGTLRCHVSRANAQWKHFDPEVEALAIFSGPGHYISPNWYAEKQATGKVVPTWNYAVVHAYGHLQVIEEPAWLRAHVENLTKIHENQIREVGVRQVGLPEQSGTEPWAVSDAPADYIASIIRGIVGFEMKIKRLEGKWKVSQNRSEADRLGIIEGLSALETPAATEMVRLVDETP